MSVQSLESLLEGENILDELPEEIKNLSADVLFFFEFFVGGG